MKCFTRLTAVVTMASAALTMGFVSGGGVATAATASPTGGKAKVEVGDNFFKPIEIEVPAGTKVTWTNKGKILHNVKPNKGDKFGTRALAKGKSYSYRFKKPGKYAYYCTFHGSPSSGQRGTIIVTAPPPPTTTSTTAPPG